MSWDPDTDSLEHADEIAEGMRDRVTETIQRTGQSVSPVVFSTADVLYLVAAYEHLRQRTQGDRP